MNVVTVIVTYGNRFNLLRKVVDGALACGTKRIVIVDNNSEKESKSLLNKLETELKNILYVKYLQENTGSAKGYSEGLKIAISYQDCEAIWLLDDDNLPRRESLNECITFWEGLCNPTKETDICLVSFRTTRPWHREAVRKGNPEFVLGKKNSFLRFYLFSFPSVVLSKLIEILTKKKFYKFPNITNGIVAATAYGGMFFHKNLLEKIGYPNEHFYLYVDDNEFSYRITKNNGSIVLLIDSVIDDIDSSWDTKNINSFFRILQENSSLKVYYSIRNRVYFEKKERVTNEWIYRLNMYSWLSIMLIFSLFMKKRERFCLIWAATKDGLNARLGKNNAIGFQ